MVSSYQGAVDGKPREFVLDVRFLQHVKCPHVRHHQAEYGTPDAQRDTGAPQIPPRLHGAPAGVMGMRNPFATGLLVEHHLAGFRLAGVVPQRGKAHHRLPLRRQRLELGIGQQFLHDHLRVNPGRALGVEDGVLDAGRHLSDMRKHRLYRDPVHDALGSEAFPIESLGPTHGCTCRSLAG
jgi:hypothetical protein